MKSSQGDWWAFASARSGLALGEAEDVIGGYPFSILPDQKPGRPMSYNAR